MGHRMSDWERGATTPRELEETTAQPLIAKRLRERAAIHLASIARLQELDTELAVVGSDLDTKRGDATEFDKNELTVTETVSMSLVDNATHNQVHLDLAVAETRRSELIGERSVHAAALDHADIFER
jgi:hypothetical protein